MKDSLHMDAGEPFGILADVDRQHLPDLLKMLSRCVGGKCIELKFVSMSLLIDSLNSPYSCGYVARAGTSCGPRSLSKMSRKTTMSGRASIPAQTIRSAKVCYSLQL